jgi:hypothetical protein
MLLDKEASPGMSPLSVKGEDGVPGSACSGEKIEHQAIDGAKVL